jgi:dGTPase
MREHGGFEGNAQTLRLLTRLEKKSDDLAKQIDSEGRTRWYDGAGDAVVGLNLCARTIASVLKYDREIRSRKSEPKKKEKGYYSSESSVVDFVKRSVIGATNKKLKCVECQIMDFSDDIAYSTYDIEDAFKGKLLTPFDLLFPPPTIIEAVAQETAKELGEEFSGRQVEKRSKSFSTLF